MELREREIYKAGDLKPSPRLKMARTGARMENPRAPA